MKKKRSVLVVDDIPENVAVINNILRDHYTVKSATSGESALKLANLQTQPDLILLDIMMPEMDGFEVCKRLKNYEETKEIPVVFITASENKDDVIKGLHLGAYYYLNKPVEPEVLLAIANAAIEEHITTNALKEQIRKTTSSFALIESGQFRFRTIEEAKQLAVLISKACPSPVEQMVGLVELMINAVEHGNLGISYDRKGELKAKGTLDEEINRLLTLPENQTKSVLVRIVKNEAELSISIRDEGKGFDWTPYLDFDPDRLFDSHGRGIAVANHQSFDHLKYHGIGNEVTASIQL